MTFYLTLDLVAIVAGYTAYSIVRSLPNVFAQPDIMTQLENARRCTANPETCQGLCFGACPEETDAGILMKKWGYNSSDPEDSLEFITNYGIDKLVNKTALIETGNFCFDSHCVNVTQEALETQKLFDSYW